MLTFKNVNIFFGIALILLAGYDWLQGLSFYAYIILIFLYSALLFYGSYRVDSGFFVKVICSAKTDQKQVALSFDDGPADSHTAAILHILRKQDIKAAFFCIGRRIAGNEDVFRLLHEEGHIIGNHSYSHNIWFDFFTSKKMYADLQQMDKEMENIVGLRPRLFRPPYGVTNPPLRKAILLGNYIAVGWNIRSMDTVIRDEKRLLHKILRSLKPGAIILLHDTSAATMNILPLLIQQVKTRGYEIVRLDKLLNLEPYA